MFSRRKNKPLVLSLDDSNYAPAPNPNSLQPQPATGQNVQVKPLPTAPTAPTAHAVPAVPPHLAPTNQPYQQSVPQSAVSYQGLANSYNNNESKRPLPVIAIPQQEKKSEEKQPTIINNYYYMQSPPHASAPIMAPYSEAQQLELLKQQRQTQLQRDLEREREQNRIAHAQNHSSTSSLSSSRNGKNPTRSRSRSHRRPSNNLETNHLRDSSIIVGVDNDYDDDDVAVVDVDVDDEIIKSSQMRCSDGKHNSGSPINKKPTRVTSSSSLQSGNAADATTYDLFVRSGGRPYTNTNTNNNTNNNNAKKSSHRKENSSSRSTLIDSIYQRDGIYSSATITDDSRNKVNLNGTSGIAKIPDIGINYLDPDILDNEMNNLSLNEINLMRQLKKLNDDDISVHNDDFYKFYQRCCSPYSCLTLEPLGRILCDPYNSNNRFSYRTLSVLMNTFSSGTSSSMDEMDFRKFIKMCKFIKGCYYAFNYHDTRGNDHVLDFEEFRKALKFNRMACSDSLLARIFSESVKLDFEHFLVAVIWIRKEQKQ